MEFDCIKRGVPRINLTPLMDVAFILVIFIVLVANFQRVSQVKVSLPKASDAASADPTSLVVVVRQSDPIDIAGETFAFQQLREGLLQKKGKYTSVLPMADGDVNVQRTIDVLSAAQAVGFASVGIATKTVAGGAR